MRNQWIDWYNTEQSSDVLDHVQIKTIGSYEKWVHTYDFSENGEFLMDHSKEF